MTVDEFVERTEHTPTDAEWANLMREYNRNDWEDKDMFCRRWLIQHGQYHKIGEIIRRRKQKKLTPFDAAAVPTV